MNPLKKRNKGRLVLFFCSILFFIMCFFNVSADFGTHINVSITEQVFQQTSFAENFTLTEWQKSCYSLGTVNITNPNNETIYDIHVSFRNTGGLSTNFTWDNTTKFGNQTSGQPGTEIILFVPELRQGDNSLFRYNISCMGVDPPVNVITNYYNFEHGFDRKVLSGHEWTINQTVRNDNQINVSVTNINISMTAADVVWNSTQFSFYLNNLYPYKDFANVHGNGTSNVSWWWAPSGGTIAWHRNTSIRYNMTAPLSVPFTATYLALKERVEFLVVNTLLSNLTIDDINASSQVDFDFDKRIIKPSDNEQNHNVTWEITPRVTVPVNISYNLNKVSLWVTQNQDPTNTTAGTLWGLLGKNFTGSPLQEINITKPWGNSSYVWTFNYTDGSSSAYPPPIVWMKPEYLISDMSGQIVNYTMSVSGNDTYLKYIYVVHGYWLQIAKNITNIGEDQYQVKIHVENIGNGWTPQFEKVTVYDFVPNDFGIWNMSPSYYSCALGGSGCSNLSVGSPGSDYYGMSYRWDIQWKGTMNSSLGPKFGPDATAPANYSWDLSYKVNGTGPYRVTDLYIVGLDPLKVDGAFTSPIITIISGIRSHSNEIIYLAVILFLIVVNISNLVITSRIHRKLQQRMPQAPQKRDDGNSPPGF